MVSYTFLYTDTVGEAVRWTSMQCGSDGEALNKARETMRDDYATLKVFQGERVVGGQASAG